MIYQNRRFVNDNNQIWAGMSLPLLLLNSSIGKTFASKVPWVWFVVLGALAYNLIYFQSVPTKRIFLHLILLLGKYKTWSRFLDQMISSLSFLAWEAIIIIVVLSFQWKVSYYASVYLSFCLLLSKRFFFTSLINLKVRNVFAKMNHY